VETIHLCLGRPKDVVFNSPYYYRVNGRQKMISNEFVNFFRFDNNVTFVEKDNKVRLLAIDLSKNKKAYFKISDTLRLSYNFTLNNLCEIFKFNINDEDFPPLVPDIIPFYVDGENKFRFFTFYTGESEGVRIELYFDIYDRLRVIYIEPYFE
jgi:hypothetical protein